MNEITNRITRRDWPAKEKQMNNRVMEAIEKAAA